MPRLTRWFIKSALLYFALSMLVGVAVSAQGVARLPPVVAALMPVYVHLFMVGWVTQMILGVAHWMFPRVPKESADRAQRLALVTYVTLNVGLLVRAFAEPAFALRPGPVWAGMLILSAGLQWISALAFVATAWPRVRQR